MTKFSWDLQRSLVFPKALPTHWPSLCTVVSEEQEYNDQYSIMAEIPLCLTVTYNIHISVHDFKKSVDKTTGLNGLLGLP